MYIDAHCHLSDLRIQHKIGEIIEDAKNVGIHRFLQAGVSPDDWKRQVLLAKNYPNEILCCFGLHPYFVSDNSRETCENALKELESNLENSLGLGETGLDFRSHYLEKPNRESAKQHQTYFFEEQIKMAKRNSKPLVLHIVRAHDEAIKLLKKYAPLKALIHAFNASPDVAHKYIDLDIYISFGGSSLNPNNSKLESTIKAVPLNRLLIESDSPDQLPKGFNWPYNEPKIIPLVAEHISVLKGLSKEVVLEATTQNFEKLFF